MKSLTALILAGSLFAVPAFAIETQPVTYQAKTKTQVVTKTTVHPKKHHKKHTTKHVKKTTRVVTTHHHEESTGY